jgi:hypothetical protein
MLSIKIGKSRKKELAEEFRKPYFSQILTTIEKEKIE